jgi:diaminopimelate epimerase
LRLVKYHGLGNDFLIVDRDEIGPEADPGGLARRLCERHTGPGADGLVVLDAAAPAGGDLAFRIFNADGSEAEISGNGIRCAAAHLFASGRVPGPAVSLATAAGIRRLEIVSRQGGTFLLRTEMGVPRLDPAAVPFDDGRLHAQIIDYPLPISGKIHLVTCLSMGNPHCGLFFDHLPGRLEWQQAGALIENHPFFPRRTNVEFIRVSGRSEIEVLFWERGVGETLASGSGACAAAAAAMLKGYVDRSVRVRTGLGSLLVEWPDETSPVFQTGPAEAVYAAEV